MSAEITSFNQLFWEARSAGLRLVMFEQTPDGRFHAQWQRGVETYDNAEHALPFDCLLTAYLNATRKPSGWLD